MAQNRPSIVGFNYGGMVMSRRRQVRPWEPVTCVGTEMGPLWVFWLLDTLGVILSGPILFEGDRQWGFTFIGPVCLIHQSLSELSVQCPPHSLTSHHRSLLFLFPVQQHLSEHLEKMAGAIFQNG